MATRKQKALAKKILENPSTPDVTSADMQEVGYSPNTRPNEIINTKGWQDLMDKYLPDEDLLQAHKEGLKANKVISAKIIGDANESTDDFIEVPDHAVRSKFLELGYKVKNKYQNGVQILNKGDMEIKFE